MNKFGLPRNIPDKVKEEVRIRCGFGCVICGSIPYQYDHFRVPFAEAKEHDAGDIILLCDNHHAMKTRRQISIDFIERARKVGALDRDAHFKLPGTDPKFAIRWPAVEISARSQSIMVDGENVLQLRYQADELEPVIVDGVFCDRSGDELCTITRNELIVRPNAVYDFHVTARRFQFRDKRRRRSLAFELSDQGLEITDIAHVRRGAMVLGNAGGLWLSNGVMTVLAKDVSIEDCQTAFSITSRGFRDYETFDITRDPKRGELKNLVMSGMGVAVAL